MKCNIATHNPMKCAYTVTTPFNGLGTQPKIQAEETAVSPTWQQSFGGVKGRNRSWPAGRCQALFCEVLCSNPRGCSDARRQQDIHQWARESPGSKSHAQWESTSTVSIPQAELPGHCSRAIPFIGHHSQGCLT